MGGYRPRGSLLPRTRCLRRQLHPRLIGLGRVRAGGEALTPTQTGWVWPAPRTAVEPICEVATTRKRPSHALAGIGRSSCLYSENGSLEEMATSGTFLSRGVTTHAYIAY